MDRKIDSEVPLLPSGIVTPPVGSPRQDVQQLVMAPGLPLFSGSEPTPHDEGTYDQWKFQVNGMRSSCTEPTVRSALITSLHGEASELIGFVGFGAPLGAILEAMDKRFGKRSTTDRLQQEFFQLQQEKGERIQHFASRLEKSFRKLQEAFPDRYKEEQLKERLFHGVNQQTRDSMRFLYTKESTTYESLLAAIKEAEIEWMESKGQFWMKAANVIDRTDEIEELKQKIEKLTATVKSNSFKGARPKKDKKEGPSGSESPKNKSPRKEDPRNMSKGPATTSAGPFKPNQKPFQCHKCQGWGHGWRECATKGNVDWARIYRESEPQGKDCPRKRSTINRDRIVLKELYHNPDPLYRLIGEPNETSVIVENQTVKGLIDSGAQISSHFGQICKRIKFGSKEIREPSGFGANRRWASSL